jgi:hypothetical protein
VPTGVDEQTGVGGGDAVGGEVVPPKHFLDLLPGDVGEEGLERIVEGAVAEGDTLECAQCETMAVSLHH